MKKYFLLITIILQGLNFYGQVPSVERDALISLYNVTDGPNWTFNGLWTSAQPVANWFGVDVENISGQDHVTGIFLNLNGLIGYIPSEIGNFSYLKDLDLGFNQLSGNIPVEISNLSNLETLSLEVCQFSGSIPTEIGSLINLINLTLAVNQFTGSIPEEIGYLSNLSTLDLRYNELSGTVPTEIETLTNIEGIALSNNLFSGELDLSDLPNLLGLFLENNDFSLLNVQNGNNTNFDFIDITNNPNLVCVFVDDAIWSETNWPNIDETSHYVETQAECDVFMGIDDVVSNQNISLYPNPTFGKLYIDTVGNDLSKEIYISNVLGETKTIQITDNPVDLSGFSAGIYYVKIRGISDVHKIIKMSKK